MKVRTRCGHCGKVYNMSADHIGMTAQCKQCHNTFLMTPTPEGSPASATQPAPPATAAYQAQPPRQEEAPQAQAYATQQTDQGAFAAPPQGLSVDTYEGQMTADSLPKPFDAPPPPDPFTAQTYGNGAQTALFQPPPQAAGRPAIDPSLQTVVCPKCHFTSGIHPVGGKVILRCQECGKIFSIKADPRFKNYKKAAKTNGQSGRQKKTGSPALIILGGLVVAAIIFLGPVFLPGIIPNLLPF